MGKLEQDLRKIYWEIVRGEEIDPGQIKPRRRIAIARPDQSLDVIKVDAIGYAPIMPGKLIAVAKVCPGQASMRLMRDGKVSLNQLVEIEQIIRAYPYNGGSSQEPLGILKNYERAHWRTLRTGSRLHSVHPIYSVSKSQMSAMMEAVQPLLDAQAYQ